MEWYQDYQGYHGYQDYQGYQDSSYGSCYQFGFQRREFQQESKKPWELAIEKLANETSKLANAISERFDRIEASQRNQEVLLGKIANYVNSWDQEDLPNQEDVEFDLVEDIEYPSSTNHVFQDDATDESTRELL